MDELLPVVLGRAAPGGQALGVIPGGLRVVLQQREEQPALGMVAGAAGHLRRGGFGGFRIAQRPSAEDLRHVGRVGVSAGTARKLEGLLRVFPRQFAEGECAKLVPQVGVLHCADHLHRLSRVLRRNGGDHGKHRGLAGCSGVQREDEVPRTLRVLLPVGGHDQGPRRVFGGLRRGRGELAGQSGGVGVKEVITEVGHAPHPGEPPLAQAFQVRRLVLESGQSQGGGFGLR